MVQISILITTYTIQYQNKTKNVKCHAEKIHNS